MKRTTPAALHLARLLCILGVVRALHAAPPDDAALRDRIDEIAAAELARPGAVGLSIAVARGGKVIHEAGYGLAEIEFHNAAGPQTLFRIGSVTKQYTAAAILRLVEQGKIDLDSPFSRYYSDFPNPGDAITIRHLLTHTSGIKSYTGVGEFWREGVARDLSAEQLLDFVRNQPLEFEPGWMWSYNNTAYYLLGPIIEAVSGMEYAAFLQQEFFTPLGLERTRFDSNAEIIPDRAQGYSFRGDGREPDASPVLQNDGLINPVNAGAAGGLIASAGDLARWSLALHEGHLLSDASYREMITPVAPGDGSTPNYGMGVAMSDLEDHKALRHGGGIFGFNSYLVYLPEDGMHIAVISNGATSSDKVVRQIARATIGDGL